MAIKKILAVVLAAWFLASLQGCHTMEGVGKDIEKGGEAIQEGAN